jgi:Holliday junction resolvasome RuvABC endonuclease subunit
MIYVGIDPGFSGAWGMIDHHGAYVSCGDMIHDGKHIKQRMVWAEMSQALDRQDRETAIEVVHSMPKQGVASSFKFGMAYGVALGLVDRLLCPAHLVTPQAWKKAMGLTSDKRTSLNMARELWPNAPLGRQKDNGRAEALLIAEWARRNS